MWESLMEEISSELAALNSLLAQWSDTPPVCTEAYKSECVSHMLQNVHGVRQSMVAA